MKWKLFGFKTILMVITSVFLTSCYSDYGLTSSDYDVVITQYNKQTDFSKYKKYAIVDSVFHLTGDSTKPDSEYLSRAYDDFIIRALKQI